MKHDIERTCKDCENVDLIPLTRIEAVFELYDSGVIWETPCSNCGSTNCKRFGYLRPALDRELLDMWGNDLKLFFVDQDQELVLSKYDYFPMLLEAIDEERYPKTKIDILIGAVCILLYDNTVSSEEEYSKKENNEREDIAEKVRPELIKRKNRIIEAGDSIRGDIQEVVYPQIGI